MVLLRVCVFFYCNVYETPSNTIVLSRLLVKLLQVQDSLTKTPDFQVLYLLNKLQTTDIVCVKMPCTLSGTWWVWDNCLLILNYVI